MTNPEEVESPYISEEISLSRVTPFHALWAIFKINSWKFLAHHPLCSRYRNHVFKVGPFHLCVGCTSLYSGIILFITLFFSIPSIFQKYPLIITIVPFYGFGLAILHYFLKLKGKWFKAFFRFSAGVGIGAYFGLIILVPKWWIRFALLALFLVGYPLYGVMRGPNANREKCINCPLASADPPCNPIRNTRIKTLKINQIIDQELAKIKKKKESKVATSRLADSSTDNIIAPEKEEGNQH